MFKKVCRYKINNYLCRNNLKLNNMKTEIETTKKIMNLLLECVKDKNISIKERNVYYAEYLQLFKNLYILSK